MDKLDLYQTNLEAADGTPIHLVYEQAADILEIFFGENEPATGIELTDQIVLRFNQHTGRAVSLLILDFSILTERTVFGPRSYPLNAFTQLPEQMQLLVRQLVLSPPVNQFIKVSQLQISATEQLPLTYVTSQPMLV